MSWLTQGYDWLNKQGSSDNPKGYKIPGFNPNDYMTKFTQSVSGARKAVETAQTQADQAIQDKETALAKEGTTRQLELLRQGLGQQRQAGISALRHSLASRGMLGSGSEWGGMSDINQNMGNLMAQGTMQAATGETNRLQDLYQQAQQRNFQQQQQQREIEAQRAAAAQNYSYQQKLTEQAKPSWWEYLLGGLGSLGTSYLGGKLAGGKSA